MDYGSVYGSLLEIFPQIDTRILKAVAVEHPNDADEAAAIVLSEIIPSLPSNSSLAGFTQSQNKSKRERKLERELNDIAAKSSARSSSSSSGAMPMSVAPIHNYNMPSLNGASPSMSSAYPSSSGPIRMSVSTGLPVLPRLNSSSYSSSGTIPVSSAYPSSGTVPMGGAFSYNFNAPSSNFHVAPDSKSSAYSSPSGTIPIGVAPSHNLKALSPGYHFVSGSKSTAYPSSPGTIPSVVARSHNLNSPSTGFQFTSASNSSAYASPVTIPPVVAPMPMSVLSGGIHNYNMPSLNGASASKSSAYPSSSATIPMGFAPSLSVNATSTGLVLNKKELTNSPQNGFVVPREEIVSFLEKAYEKDQEKSKKTMTCSPEAFPNFNAPNTDLISNWDEMEKFWDKCVADKLDKSSAVPCKAQIGLNEPEDDGTASVVSPVTKEHIEPIDLLKLVDLITRGDNTTNIQKGFCSEMESASTNVVDETSNDDTEQDAHVLPPLMVKQGLNLTDDQSGEMRQETKVDGDSAKLSDDKESSMESDDDDEFDSLYQDDYLRDYSNMEELNQQESSGELTPKTTTFAESTTSIGSENAVEKLVDSPTAGDNVTNIEEDLSFEVVPMSTNVVDEASNGDTELDDALITSTNGFNVDHLDEIIADAKSNKKALATAMESVTELMREVEIQEKDAEKTREEAGKGGVDTLEKVEELKKMLKHAKEANDMHAGEVYGERSILATEAKELENRLVYLSEDRNKSLAVLDEMREALEVRLETAMEMKKMVEEEQKEKEDSALKLLAEQEALMEKVVEESNLLQQEAEENSKLREFLMDRGQIVDSLQGEISVICEDVKLLKEKFENRVSSLTKSISFSSETSSLRGSPSMSSSLVREDPETLSIDTVKETVEDSSMNKEKKEDEDWDIFDKEFDEFVVW